MLDKIEQAKKKIQEAEAELWPLSDGERRDLLKDNFPWDSEEVCEIVAMLRHSTT